MNARRSSDRFLRVSVSIVADPNPYAASTSPAQPRPVPFIKVAWSVTLGVQAFCLAAAHWMEPHRLYRPHPIMHGWRHIATWLFLGSFVLWVLGVIWCASAIFRRQGLSIFASGWLAISCLYFGYMFFDVIWTDHW